MALIDGLISYWKLDENTTNTTVADSHGSNTGVAYTNTSNLYDASGKINSALHFPVNTTGHIDLDPFPDVSTGDYSYQAWFKLDTLKNYNYVMESMGTVTNEYIISVRVGSTGTLQIYSIQAPSVNIGPMTVTGLSVDNWYHVVVTHDLSAKTYKLYLNGVYKATTTYTGTLKVMNELTLANDRIPAGDNSRVLDGLLDEVGIWSKVLSDGGVALTETATGDIAELYNSGNGLAYPFALATLRQIKISGSFVDKPILTKVAGTFVDKPIKIKVGGTFQ